MLEKISDASKLVLLPTLMLYSLGFLVVSSYLAKFGFQTFDIVNARFVIAGLFPAISIGIAVYLGVDLRTMLMNCPPFNYQRSAAIARLKAFFFYIARYILIRTAVISFLTAHYVSSSPLKLRSFARPNWLFSIDPVDKALLSAISMASGDQYFVGVFLWLFWRVIELSLLVLAVASVRWAYRRLSPVAQATVNQLDQSIEQAPSGELSPLETTETIPRSRLPKLFSSITAIAMGVCETIIVVSAMSGVVWSIAEIAFASAGPDNISSLTANTPDSFGDAFSAWLLPTVLGIAFFTELVANKELAPQLDLFWKKMAVNPFLLFQNLITPLVGSVLIFGVVVFPRIPFELGGGQPRPVTMTIKIPVPHLADGQLYLVGESAQFFFAVESDDRMQRALQVSKDNVISVQTGLLSSKADSDVH